MNKKTLAYTLGSAIVTALTASPMAHAEENPFGLQSISTAVVAAADAASPAEEGADKMPEGKCGADKAKMPEGKCGADKTKMTEGKCGADKTKMTEGKCGADKKMKEATCGDKKKAADKMPEAACGDKKK